MCIVYWILDEITCYLSILKLTRTLLDGMESHT